MLVLDEATSNLDAASDDAMQALLRSPFCAGVTVLTIAHRLSTIIDYDQLLVLAAGRSTRLTETLLRHFLDTS